MGQTDFKHLIEEYKTVNSGSNKKKIEPVNNFV